MIAGQFDDATAEFEQQTKKAILEAQGAHGGDVEAGPQKIDVRLPRFA
jgi:hypothetical protein